MYISDVRIARPVTEWPTLTYNDIYMYVTIVVRSKYYSDY